MDQQQLELMWQYQQEDMKADRIANDIRRSPTRQKLEKSRDFIMEQQKLYKQIEEQVAIMADRKDAIRDAIARCEEQLNALAARFKAAPPEDAEAARAMLQEVSKCRDTIASYEQEMNRIVKDSNEHDRKQRSIRHEAAKVKMEFDQLKQVYDKEIQEKKAALDAQRAVANEKAALVDKELMAEYLAIKKHIAPPMARLIGDQCSGCNTAQPSALLRKIKSGTVLVECETCGRMIIQ
ncbi:MAG: zinc ribbon domain-containing protein [Aristaeellaceae bacterium]